MNLELNPWSAVIILSWLCSVSRLHLVPVLISLLIFCSTSVSFGILMLILLQILAFAQASIGMKRATSGLAQRRFYLVFFGLFLALIGHALGACWQGHALGLVGLLFAIPNGITTFFFSRFYEQLSFRSYLGAVLIPSFAAIQILSRWKGEILIDLGDAWRFSLAAIGGVTVLSSGLMSLARDRLRPALVFWSHVWIGLSLLVLAAKDDSMMQQSLAAISVFVITSSVMVNCASQLGSGFFVFARSSALGLPGFVSFAALYLVLKILFDLGFFWVCFGFIGFFLQAFALILIRTRAPKGTIRLVQLRFWITVVLQMAVGIGVIWFGFWGQK